MRKSAGIIALQSMGVSALGFVALTQLLPELYGVGAGFIAALIPMVWYHVLFLRPRAKRAELTSFEVDSVYYYGFLVTIVALALAVFVVFQNQEEANLITVGAHFMLGLLATGYAVVARMDILSVSQVTEVDEGDIMDTYVSKTRRLIETIEVATNDFETFAQKLETRMDQTFANNREVMEKQMKGAVEAFRDGMTSNLEDTKAMISDMRELMTDSAFTEERAQLKKSVSASLSSLTKFNSAVSDMADKSGQSISALEALGGAASAAGDRANEFSDRMAVLGADDGPISRLNGGLSTTISSAEGASTAIRGMTERVSDLSETVGVTSGTLGEFSDGVKASTNSLSPLGDASARIAGIATSFEGVESSLGAIQSASASVATDLQNMSSSFETLLPLLQQFAAVGDEARPSMRLLGEHVAQLEKLSGSIAPAAEKIVGLTGALESYSTELKSTVEATSEMALALKDAARDVPALTSSLSEMPRIVDDANGAFGRFASGMDKMVVQFEGASDKATQSLSAAAESGSQYIDRLGSSFTGLATFIIDQTNKNGRS